MGLSPNGYPQKKTQQSESRLKIPCVFLYSSFVLGMPKPTPPHQHVYIYIYISTYTYPNSFFQTDRPTTRLHTFFGPRQLGQAREVQGTRRLLADLRSSDKVAFRHLVAGVWIHNFTRPATVDRETILILFPASYLELARVAVLGVPLLCQLAFQPQDLLVAFP